MLIWITVVVVFTVFSVSLVALWVGGDKKFHYEGSGVLSMDDVCKIVAWYRGKVDVLDTLPEGNVKVFYNFESDKEGEFGLFSEENHKIRPVSMLLMVFVIIVGLLSIAFSAIITLR